MKKRDPVKQAKYEKAALKRAQYEKARKQRIKDEKQRLLDQAKEV